jgi:predicted Rossmann fold nucleotide-binding protein DprA/Smf involved in DNA uptake
MREKIAIVGSRSFSRLDLVEAYVAALPDDAVVVSGGAPGVDSIAEGAARRRGLEVLVFAADWRRLGRKAGPLRNRQIVAAADRVAAFWNGKSRGTLNTILQAIGMGRAVTIFGSDGYPVALTDALAQARRLGVAGVIEDQGD